MIFSSGGRLLSRSARSAFQKNLISVYNNGNAAFRHQTPTPLAGNAGITNRLGLLRSYLIYHGAGKQLVSNTYMSNLKSALANPRMRRLFSSERPGKKNYENYYPKEKKGIPKGNDQKSGSKDGSGDQGSNFSKQIVDLTAPLLFMGFVLISLLLTPQQQKQISFQEFKNTLLEPGLVDHIEVANKSVAKVFVRSSPRIKDEISEVSVKGPGDSSSEGASSKYKYYFNIGSVDSFEEKLEEAQEALGVDRHYFVPVIYVAQVNWFGELMKYSPTILLLGALWFMGRKMPGIGGPGGRGIC